MIDNAEKQEAIVDFHLQQYASVRKEIEEDIRESRLLERYGLIGTGLIWTWLLTHNFTSTNGINIPQTAWWIPCVLVAFCGMRSAALLKGILRASKYIRQMEEVFFYSEKIPGWETFVKKEKVAFITLSAILFWILLFVVTIIGPFVFIK